VGRAQGTSIEDFEVRRDQAFWRGLRERVPGWDASIAAFNERAGTGEAA
jgi:hypothetical protein